MLLPVLLFLAVFTCEAHKILVVIPKMGYSHMNYLGSIADTLVDAGYDVVSLQPVIFPHVNNGTRKSRLIQVDMDEAKINGLLATQRSNQERMWTGSATNPLGVIASVSFLGNIAALSAEQLLENKELLERLKSEKFDLGI
ncbi:unnamed protein product, partial [Strongylus vulgaris]